MRLIEKLGLGNKKKTSEPKSSTYKNVGQKVREEKTSAAAQDMCCGSCGGHGHTDRKDWKG